MRKNAYRLSLLMVFMIPWENVVVIPGIGTISKFAGLLIAGFWMLTVLFTGWHRKLQTVHLVILVYFFWHLLSYFWSVDDAKTLTRIGTYAQIVVMIILLWDLYTTPETVRTGLQAYVIGAYISIGSTVLNYIQRIHADYLRYSATGFDPNDISLVIALGIPIAWYLASYNHSESKISQLRRMLNYAYAPVAVFAILLTASRSGLIEASFALLFIVLSFAKLDFGKKLGVLVLAISILISIQSVVPQSSFERLATIRTSIYEGDMNHRVEIWREGLGVWWVHPFIGAGSATFASAIPRGTVAHNSFISIFTETGIVGFSIFAILLGMVTAIANGQKVEESRLWFTLLFILGVGMMTLSWEHRKQVWLIVSFIITGTNISSSCENHQVSDMRGKPLFEELGS